MPTYTIDMGGGGALDAWGEGASALARAFTPDPKLEAEARVLASQQDANFARAASSLATRDRTRAQTWEQERRNRILGRLDADVAAGELMPDEALELAAEAGILMDPEAAALNVGQIGLGLTGFNPNVTREEQDRWAMASGANYADTFAGFQDAQAQESQLAADAAAAAAAESQRERAAAAATAVDERAAEAEADTVPVLIDGQIRLVPRNQAVEGQLTPVLSKTNVEGAGLLDPTLIPGAEGGGGPFLEGTGMSQQALNYIDTYNAKIRAGQGTTPDEDRQYRMMFNEAYGPQDREVSNADGTKTIVRITPNIPAGLWNPNTGTLTGQEPAATATETGEGGESTTTTATTAAPAGSPAQEVATIGNPRVKYTEGQQKLVQLGGQIATGVTNMNALAGYDPTADTFYKRDGRGFWPGAMNVAAGDIVEGVADSFLPESIGDMARNKVLTPENRRWEDLKFTVIEPMLRLASGAATPEEEVRRYGQYIPQAGLPDSENAARLRRMNVIAASIANVAEAQGLSSADLLQMAETRSNLGPISAAIQAEMATMGVTDFGAQPVPEGTPAVEMDLDRY